MSSTIVNLGNNKNEFDAKAATWDAPEKIERAQIMADAILAIPLNLSLIARLNTVVELA